MEESSSEDEPEPPFECDVCGRRYTNRGQHRRWCKAPDPSLEPPPPVAHEPVLPDIARMTLVDSIRSSMAADLLDMRYERGFNEADIEFVKSSVRAHNAEIAAAAPRLLQPYVRDDVSLSSIESVLQIDLFAGLKTAKQEMAQAKKDVPQLTPRVVDHKPNGKAKVVTFRMADMLMRMLKHDRHFRTQVLKKSEQWKQGHLWKKEPVGMMKNFDDGIVARFHPHLMRPCANEKEAKYAVRVAIISNADDIEVRHSPPFHPWPSPWPPVPVAAAAQPLLVLC